MKWLCIILLLLGAAVVGRGIYERKRAASGEQRGLADITIGLGAAVLILDAAIFIVWKLVT
ncbi:MAG TPA: hypothetical protein VIH40_13760 [Xanthobacteraceae bacterium]